MAEYPLGAGAIKISSSAPAFTLLSPSKRLIRTHVQQLF